jgi:hypothetical protein
MHVDVGRVQTGSPPATVSPPSTENPPDSDPTFPRDAVLAHISQRENIPVNQLNIIYKQRGFSEWLEKEFWYVKVEDVQSGKEYGVQIDLSDNSFIDDINEIRSKELEARWAKYGKMDVELSEVLQKLSPEDQVPIFIRSVILEMNVEQLNTSLAAKFPEAQKALERVGNPFEVNDLDLIMKIKQEKMRLLENNIQGQIKPLVDDLEAGGYKVTKYPGTPYLAVTLPKKAILELAQRSDVAELLYAGHQQQPALNIAVPSERVQPLWNKGFQGFGVKISIIENGTIDFTGPQQADNWLHKGLVRTPCNNTQTNAHNTVTANDAASYSDALSTDLDLHVYGPTGEINPPSASLNNNFEIVEFIAPSNGNYRIDVVRSSIILPPVGEQENYVGIAWAKDATYLPDLRNKNGWLSLIYVRNDNALTRNVTIDYFQQNGTQTIRDTCNLGPNEYCWLPVDDLGRIPADSVGTAVVGGGEDVTVVVENVKSNTTSTNYVGFLSASQSGHPDWDQVSPTLYAPRSNTTITGAPPRSTL